jgi:hypothetical protein
MHLALHERFRMKLEWNMYLLTHTIPMDTVLLLGIDLDSKEKLTGRFRGAGVFEGWVHSPTHYCTAPDCAWVSAIIGSPLSGVRNYFVLSFHKSSHIPFLHIS